MTMENIVGGGGALSQAGNNLQHACRWVRCEFMFEEAEWALLCNQTHNVFPMSPIALRNQGTRGSSVWEGIGPLPAILRKSVGGVAG